jgi:serpin B
LFSSIDHIGEPVKYLDLSITLRNSGFRNSHEISEVLNLAKDLKKMGMPVAFSDKADFSGMDGVGNLVISEVVHKAYIEVNEEGTEAAAATGVIMYGDAMSTPVDPIPVFYANHPFIFFIQDNNTGTILFMGRVVNPVNS